MASQPVGQTTHGKGGSAGVLDPATRRLILLLPAAFLAHDLGELAGNDELNRAVQDLTGRLSPGLAERALPAFTTSQAQAGVAIGTWPSASRGCRGGRPAPPLAPQP